MNSKLKLLSLLMGAVSSLQMLSPLATYAADPNGPNENNVSQKANENLSAIDINSENVNELNEDGYAPLHLQVQEDNLGAVEFLISKGADISIKDKNGDTPLHTAAREDAIECLVYLISKGADVEAKNIQGETPLMIAAKEGNRMVFSTLLEGWIKEKRADINAVDDKNNTVLHYLAGSDMDGLVNILSSLKKENCFSQLLKMGNEKNNAGETPLFNAIRSKNEELAMFLIKNGAIDVSNNNGQTALMLAAQNGLKGLVRELVKKGSKVDAVDNEGNTLLHFMARDWDSSLSNVFSDPDNVKSVEKPFLQLREMINVANEKGKTPLFVTTKNNQLELAELLIKSGADINAEDKYGKTPLLNAAMKDKYELTKLLIENGAMLNYYNGYPLALAVECCCGFEVVKLLFDSGLKIDAKDCGKALFHAVEKNDFRLAKCLIENGADVNFEVGRLSMQTPIYMAVRNNSFELAKLLIENGANVNRKYELKKTLLHIAAESCWFKIVKGKIYISLLNSFDIVKLLIESGVNVNAKDSDGETPLHKAAKSGNLEVSKLLIGNGVNVNAKNLYEETPLHKAAENGISEVSRLLIRNGAKDSSGDPIHEAEKNGKFEVSKLLIENGADVNAKDFEGETPLDLATDPQIRSLLEEKLSK